MKASQKKVVQSYFMKILNGLGTGTVIVVLPAGLFGQLFRLLQQQWSVFSVFYTATQFVSSLMGMVSGVIIGLLFELSPLEAVSVGLAVIFAGGAIQFREGAIVMQGMGDIIVMAVTAAIAVMLVKFVSYRLKVYQLLLLPSIVLFVAGGIGALIYPTVSQITTAIGTAIQYMLGLQPLVMALLIAAAFALLIISPITSAGVAITIGLVGLGAGIAGVGISAAGLGLALAGRKVNPIGTSIALIIGSPKLALANFLKKPMMFLPMLMSAAVSGVVAMYLNIQGNAMSAGFGLSGLLGPITHLSLVDQAWSVNQLLITFVAFFVVPTLMNLLFIYLCQDVLHLVKPEDYAIVTAN
ncbi:PTS sugar transporter subunit IIC [Fundicoccus sp. Sow4_H7]|uniref:PTS sugar transporter subunit IIC n=1 Tax=Fundicoccus sp. Sow4_H7 TaxID=3438784 RepID=UPI003F8FA8F6